MPRFSTKCSTSSSPKARCRPASTAETSRSSRRAIPSHGDLATNAAMVLAKRAGTNPRALAELIEPKLEALRPVTLGRDRRARLHQPAADADAWRDELAHDPRARATIMAARRSATTSGSMSNMSRPTRPGRCTWAIAAARSSATALARAARGCRLPGHRRILCQRRRRAGRYARPLGCTCATARRSARTSARSPRASIRATI